jgi:hypothetical protein
MDETSTFERARLLRGTGRYVVDYWDDHAEEWKMTIWRGIAVSIAMKEAKRLQREPEHAGMDFRVRDVDTDNVLLACIL